MTTRLRFPTLFDFFVHPPMQDRPVRVALATSLAAVVAVVGILAV